MDLPVPQVQIQARIADTTRDELRRSVNGWTLPPGTQIVPLDPGPAPMVSVAPVVVGNGQTVKITLPVVSIGPFGSAPCALGSLVSLSGGSGQDGGSLVGDIPMLCNLLKEGAPTSPTSSSST